MLGIGMTKCFKLLMCAYGAVICKLWSAIENLAVDAKIKSVVFLLWIWQWAVPLATKQRETGTNYHITDLGVLSNSGHDIIRLLSFASLQTTMGICHHVTNVIYDLAGAVTRILTCGKFKVGGYSPTLSHNNHHRHCRFQGQGRTIVAELFLLLCLMSSVTSIVWDTANAQQAKGGSHSYPFVFLKCSSPQNRHRQSTKAQNRQYQSTKMQNCPYQCTGAKIIIALLAIHIFHLMFFLTFAFFLFCSCPPPDRVIKVCVYYVNYHPKRDLCALAMNQTRTRPSQLCKRLAGPFIPLSWSCLI